MTSAVVGLVGIVLAVEMVALFNLHRRWLYLTLLGVIVYTTTSAPSALLNVGGLHIYPMDLLATFGLLAAVYRLRATREQLAAGVWGPFALLSLVAAAGFLRGVRSAGLGTAFVEFRAAG